MNTRWTGNELILSFDRTMKTVSLNIEETKEFEGWVSEKVIAGIEKEVKL